MYKILSKLILSASLIVMSAIATEPIKDDFTKHIKELQKSNQEVAWMQDDGTLGDNVSKTSDSISVLTDIISDVINDWKDAEDAQKKFIEDMQTKTNLTPANLNYIGVKNWAYNVVGASVHHQIDLNLYEGINGDGIKYSIDQSKIENFIPDALEDINKYILAFDVKNFITQELERLLDEENKSIAEKLSTIKKDLANKPGVQYVESFNNGKAYEIGMGKYNEESLGIQKYTGEYLGGVPHGVGTGVFPWGTYEGVWCFGVPKGRGKYNMDGKVYRGVTGSLRELKIEDSSNEYLHIDGGGAIYLGEGICTSICFYRNGLGAMKFSNGASYEGEWKDDRMNGAGTYTWDNGDTYEGGWKADQMHGEGTKIYADGEVYTGNWDDGKRHGKGKMIFQSGNIYDGEWLNGSKHGKGKMTFKDGGSYDGEWKDDKYEGQGMLTYVDGSNFTGTWEGGHPFTGEGTYNNLDGAYVGKMEFGKKNGQGKMTFIGGNIYEGEWKGDMMNGFGKYTWNAEWKDEWNAEWNAEWEEEWTAMIEELKSNAVLEPLVSLVLQRVEKRSKYYGDGNSYEGAWKDNMMHGEGQMIFTRGGVEKGTYMNGKKDGEWVELDQGGKPVKITTWNNGVLIK